MSTAALPVARRLRPAVARIRERLREGLGRRTTGAVVALALEALLLLALLTIGQARPPHKEAPLALTSFDTREVAPEPETPQPKSQAARAAPSPPQQQPAAVTATPPPAAIIPVTPRQVPSFDLAKVPRQQAAAAPYGPADTPHFGDSERVGTAPNGQPMYAARWYVEPTDDQMRGYLSTAEGPGWGLITCKTVPDFRVEDCVGLDEYPEGSRMLRAILAAAWQFRVRPPQIGGVSQVGDWVRIRVSYELKPANPYGDPSKP